MITRVMCEFKDEDSNTLDLIHFRELDLTDIEKVFTYVMKLAEDDSKRREIAKDLLLLAQRVYYDNEINQAIKYNFILMRIITGIIIREKYFRDLIKTNPEFD